MLETLLSQEEGKTLEFKENSDSLKNILKTVIAFANTAGGILVLGVEDKTKKVIGISDVLKEEERIANAIAESISPLISPNFQFATWRNREVLIITVAYMPTPYYLKQQGIEKGVYIRLGSTNRVADQNTITELQRLALHQSFDELPNFRATQDDIDFDLAKEWFSQAANKNFNMNAAKSLNLFVQHQNHYYPSNGAILLFGKKIQNFFSDAVIRCGCFAGTTKTEIIDQQDFIVGLPQRLAQVLAFIKRNTSIKSTIENLLRIDIPLYSTVVLREAITNAIVHTDYTVKGASIEVAIFTDRLEITSPGALPFGLSLLKAISGISQLRNRVIGHVFKELHLIERWGSGLGRMIQLCQENGIKEPKFEELDHYFRVTLYPGEQKRVTEEFWQKEMIAYIKKNKYITTKSASKLWNVTERTASRKLKKLCEEGTIVEVSTGPYDPKKKFVLSQ